MPLFNMRLSDNQMARLNMISASYSLTKTGLVEMWIRKWHPRTVKTNATRPLEEVLRSSSSESTKNKPKKPPAASRLADPRHDQVRKMICGAYQLKNSAPCPWDGYAGNALKRFLDSAPSWSVEMLSNCIANRFLSEVNHAEGPVEWIKSLVSFYSGPLDRFKKPLKLTESPSNGRKTVAASRPLLPGQNPAWYGQHQREPREVGLWDGELGCVCAECQGIRKGA